MSGQSGARGYLIQVLISVLDAFGDDNWESFTIEPELDTNKVDIIWYCGTSSKVVQIKHSQNQISFAMAKTWAKELEDSLKAESYELVLIGPSSRDVVRTNPIGKVAIVGPKVLDLVGLVEQAAQRLDRYLSSKGVSAVPPFAREIIIQALTTRLSGYSTTGKQITRENFDDTLREWILEIYPNSLNEAALQMQKEIEYLRFRLREFDRVAEAKYQLKYQACMDALALVDEIYLISSKDQIEKVYMRLNTPLPIFRDVTEISTMARKCHNNLTLTCDSTDVIELFLTIIGMRKDENFSADKIVDFRSAIRRELGFPGDIVDINRENAWIATIYPDPWRMRDS